MQLSEIPNIDKIAADYKEIRATIPVVCKNKIQRDYRQSIAAEMRRIVRVLALITGEDSTTIVDFLTRN